MARDFESKKKRLKLRFLFMEFFFERDDHCNIAIRPFQFQFCDGVFGGGMLENYSKVAKKGKLILLREGKRVFKLKISLSS